MGFTATCRVWWCVLQFCSLQTWRVCSNCAHCGHGVHDMRTYVHAAIPSSEAVGTITPGVTVRMVQARHSPQLPPAQMVRCRCQPESELIAYLSPIIYSGLNPRIERISKHLKNRVGILKGVIDTKQILTRHDSNCRTVSVRCSCTRIRMFQQLLRGI